MPDIRCHSCGQHTDIFKHLCTHCGVSLSDAPAAVQVKKASGPAPVPIPTTDGKIAGYPTSQWVAAPFVFIAVILFLWWVNAEERPKPVASATSSPAATQPQQRQAQIESQFSSWDGHHLRLERLIKQAMNDPDSYDHVQTSYIDNGTTLRVKTSYRGSNAFGAIILAEVIADVDMQGNVINIVSE